MGEGLPLAAQEPAPPADELAGRSFLFSWRQGPEGGLNGTLQLRADGRILGIGSPNETSWRLDERGRLIFLHEDGRVSTTYEEFTVREGRWCFDGTFHFREGVAHHLEETDQPPRPPARLEEGLPERLAFSSQAIVCLDPGEEHAFALRSGREVRVRLLSVEEHRDSVVKLVRRADVRVAIDGTEHELLCAPYLMPTTVGELRIQVDTTSGWCELPKRAQLSLWDAADPIIDATSFGFPLRDYRLFSHGLQCYNEPVHLGRQDGDPEGAVFHHSYGIDFAGFEGGQDVLACVEGEVVRLLPDAVLVNVRDDAGLIREHHHLDSIAGGSPIASHRWELPDGSEVEGPRAELALDRPGIFVATLRVRDEAGVEDLGFHKIEERAFYERFAGKRRRQEALEREGIRALTEE